MLPVITTCFGFEAGLNEVLKTQFIVGKYTNFIKFKLNIYEDKTNIYTGCPRRNGQNFGRVFLMLKYTDITQNTYVQI